MSRVLRSALSLQTTFHDIFARHLSCQHHFDFFQINSIVILTSHFVAISLFAVYSFSRMWAVSCHMIRLIASVTAHETRLLKIKFLIIDRINMNMRDRRNDLNRWRKRWEKDIKFDEISSRLIFSFDDAKNFIFTQITNEVNLQIFHRFRKILDNEVCSLCNYERRVYHKRSENVFLAQILSDKLIARKLICHCAEILDDLTRRFQLSHNNADFLHDDHRIVKNREI